MRPEKGDDFVSIPITFDGGKGGRLDSVGRKFWALGLLGIWLFLAIVAMITAEPLGKFFIPLFSFIILVYIQRYIVFRERFFRKKRRELIEDDYMFPHSTFWNILEISNRYPFIASLGGNNKAIFVALDKDVIVGKGNDYSYYHYEALADAYAEFDRRVSAVMHVDYMDTVGKDKRMDGLYHIAEGSQNQDVRKLLTRMYEHIEFTMNKSYASYDIYVFYSNKSDDVMWDEVQLILEHLKRANYIRARVLSRDEIAELTQSLMNVDVFSVQKANDNLFKEMNKTNYLRPIWIEKDGERTELNKTTAENKELRRIYQAERKVKVKKQKKPKKKDIQKEEEDIDIF